MIAIDTNILVYAHREEPASAPEIKSPGRPIG